MSSMSIDPEVIKSLLACDRPVPRYTSYPTVPKWSTSPPADVLTPLFAGLNGPAQIYVHVPFCRRQCAYCGCNMVVSKRQSAGDWFLDNLEQQLSLFPSFEANHLHLGGGTPTWLTAEQITRLFALFSARFGELTISVEADPVSLDEARLEALQGISRLSLGVQSLNDEVISLCDRDQSLENVRFAVEQARALGVGSLNVDLMVGLPKQTLATFEKTVDQIIDWSIDRIAVFGYAHMPSMLKHQAKLTEFLPGPKERAELAVFAHNKLTAAGYRSIGFDHYAKPEDPLFKSHICRGFMGYTTDTQSIIGLGPSAISAVNGVYVQLQPHLGKWRRATQGGELPVHRFYQSTEDDLARAAIIDELLCTLTTEVNWSLFEGARERIVNELGDKVILTNTSLTIKPEYKLLARNAASAFDASGGRQGSRAI